MTVRLGTESATIDLDISTLKAKAERAETVLKSMGTETIPSRMGPESRLTDAEQDVLFDAIREAREWGKEWGEETIPAIQGRLASAFEDIQRRRHDVACGKKMFRVQKTNGWRTVQFFDMEAEWAKLSTDEQEDYIVQAWAFRRAMEEGA